MASVTWSLFRSTIVDPATGALLVTAAALLFTTRLNSTWLVLGGGVAGAILQGAG